MREEVSNREHNDHSAPSYQPLPHTGGGLQQEAPKTTQLFLIHRTAILLISSIRCGDGNTFVNR